MGQGSAQTLKEIEQIRTDLERDLDALQERLPATSAAIKRTAGIAVGGGVGMRILRMMIKRRRRARLVETGQAPPARAGAKAKLLWFAVGAGAGAGAMAWKDRAGSKNETAIRPAARTGANGAAEASDARAAFVP